MDAMYEFWLISEIWLISGFLPIDYLFSNDVWEPYTVLFVVLSLSFINDSSHRSRVR